MDIDVEDIDKMFAEEEESKPVVKKEESVVNENDLLTYYKYLFPYKDYFQWFGAGDPSFFEKREFSFTKKGDIYIRFLCFHNAEELMKAMIKENPVKIDIGAVYNTLPKYRSTSSNTTFQPMQKELVFDIDMTDYDDVRTCCSDAKVCNRCWKYMIIAYKVLNEALTSDFGFKSIMWVFSGRRGIHCWIGDERARKLNNDGRSAIANYLKWKTINKNTGVPMLLKEPIHPCHLRSMKIINEKFSEYALDNQEILQSQKIIDIVIIILKAYLSFDKEYYQCENDIKRLFSTNKSSVEKWREMINIIKRTLKSPTVEKRTELALKEIEMAIMYPRLDINVSKHINHLLKSPFTIHPKTGMISVPLDQDTLENFDMATLPTLKEAISENKLTSETVNNEINISKNSNFEKYVKIFKKSIESFNN